jgi:plasmid stabilization system protein ParE
MQFVLSDKARLDLFRIYRYLEERSPNAADAFIRMMDSNFENLARFPSLAPGLRCLVVGLHLIFYTVDDDRVTVVRVIDARMDVDEEFHR